MNKSNHVSSKLMQLSVKISGKSFVKKSSALIDNATKVFGAENSAITGSKKLYRCDEYNKLKNAEQSLRAYIRTNTVRLGDLQVISPKRFLKVKTEISKRKDIFDEARNAFVAKLPDLEQSEKTRLGSLYNSADYVSAREIEQSFSVAVSVLPLPVANFATLGLPQEESETLTQAFSETISKDLSAMTCELLHKLINGANPDSNEGVGNGLLYAIQRLASGDSFRSGTIRNVAEISEVVRDLNALDNPDIEKLTNSLIELFGKADADTLRDNSTERETLVNNAKEQLKAIESAMEGVC